MEQYLDSEPRIFRNYQNVDREEVLKKFKEELKQHTSYEISDIEALADAYAKDFADKFIITEKLDVECAQGDILIWGQNTDMYKQEINNISQLKVSNNMVLQENDSITGDHRVVPLEGSNIVLKRGWMKPSFLKGKNSWGDRSYNVITLETDKPFLIFHREHGNICLPADRYIICTVINSETLGIMLD